MDQKLSFKKVFLTAFTLMLVAGLAGAVIVLLNMFTEPIIEANNAKLEQQKLQEVYEAAEFESSSFTDNGEEVSYYLAKSNNEVVGFVYKVSGKNAYGSITLLVGVNKNGTVKRAVIMENTESFATDINKQFNKNYHNDMTKDEVDSVDVKGGATYGATLIKDLINQALTYYDKYQKEV